ncbi:CoA-binding protein [Oleiphilus sp. HI0086]|uniref:CoA-binding protein n=3 Tax=Oleiphilus TaxID=141450 RepID=UPI000B31D8FA
MNLIKTQFNHNQLIDLLNSVETIALVGASQKPERPSNEVMNFLQNKGFKITPINPDLEGQNLLGETVIKNITKLPIKVDMVDIFRNSEAAASICDEVLALPKTLQPKVVWMQIGVINETAAAKLRAAGISVVMDRCPKRVIQEAERVSTLA